MATAAASISNTCCLLVEECPHSPAAQEHVAQLAELQQRVDQAHAAVVEVLVQPES